MCQIKVVRQFELNPCDKPVNWSKPHFVALGLLFCLVCPKKQLDVHVMVWLLRSLRLTTCLERVLDWAARGSQKGRSDCTRLVQHLFLKYIVAWVCSWDLSLDSNQLTATVTASSQGISVLKAKRGPYIQLQCALQTLFTPKIACPFLSPFDPGVLPFQGFTWAPLGLPPTLQRIAGYRGEDLTNEEVKSRKITKCHPANFFFIKILQLNGPNSETPTWIWGVSPGGQCSPILTAGWE